MRQIITEVKTTKNNRICPFLGVFFVSSIMNDIGGNIGKDIAYI
jgi:hypothetical protein